MTEPFSAGVSSGVAGNPKPAWPFAEELKRIHDGVLPLPPDSAEAAEGDRWFYDDGVGVEFFREWDAAYVHGLACALGDKMRDLRAAREREQRVRKALDVTFYGYDTHDLGRAYHADSVDDTLAEARRALDGEQS